MREKMRPIIMTWSPLTANTCMVPLCLKLVMISPPFLGFSPKNMARMILAASVPAMPEVSFWRIQCRDVSAKEFSWWVVAILWVGMA